MKYLEEYRDPQVAAALLAEIRRVTTRPWVIMEVCGGQTHSIVRYGIDQMLPPEIELAHGPGCPVCVTPLETIDRAHAIAVAARRDLRRRSATCCACPARAAICCRCAVAAPTCAWSTRRSTRSASPRRTPTSAWSSWASGSRPPRPPTPWRSTRRSGAACATSRCWPRTCWCRRRSRRSCTAPATACRRSWGRATSARSSAIASTSRWSRASACRS